MHVIAEHLICNGVDKSYRTWINHGEPLPRIGFIAQAPSSSTSTENAFPRMEDMLNDTCRCVNPNVLDGCLNESDQENDAHVQDDPP